MNRRRFLKIAGKTIGYGFGAGLVGLGVGVAWVQPRRQRLPTRPGDAGRPERPSARRKVVVVGGGLAGLVAGIELAQRDFQVTLLEAGSHLGGKLGGWPVRALGEEFPVEHGFHGFFSQYYNLREHLEAAGATASLVESPGYPVLFADRAPETFGRTTKLFPFNMLSVVRQSQSLRLREFRDDGPALYDLMRYDPATTYARFDGTDFSTFARDGGIHRAMVETVLEPFGKTTLNRLSRLSAAEAIRFFHFYFMGNPEGLGFRYATRDSMTAIVAPLAARFRSLGGVVRTSAPVARLVGDGRRVRAVTLAGSGALAGVRVDKATLGAGWRDVGGGVFMRADGSAVDGRCTHMGCPVTLDAGGGFACGCHGGRYDGDGAPTAGPPKQPLRRLAVADAGAAFVVAAAAAGEELACDHCVVACDVRGAQALVASSALPAPALARGVAALGEAEPYVVWRLWLDKPTAAERLPFYTTARFEYLDSLAVYSRFQAPYVDWARRTGGSVVELHAYAIAPEQLRAPAQMRTRLFAELLRLLPELAGARVLHDEYQQQSNFSRFAPGDHALRPSTATELDNLFLAGDWVRLDAPAALMEAAAMSGRLAANAILVKEGLRELPISTVALKGPLA